MRKTNRRPRGYMPPRWTAGDSLSLRERRNREFRNEIKSVFVVSKGDAFGRRADLFAREVKRSINA
jgi:hypothetical protein